MKGKNLFILKRSVWETWSLKLGGPDRMPLGELKRSRGRVATKRAIPAALRLGRMKEATLKHFVERLRPVFDEGRYCGALVHSARAGLSTALAASASACIRTWSEEEGGQLLTTTRAARHSRELE
jgi:hypothetical protein